MTPRHLALSFLLTPFCAPFLQAEPPVGAQWEPIPELTDEFNDTALDSAKWLDSSPGWDGRQPGYFAKSNVKVMDGQLQLTARVEDPPAEAQKNGYHTFTTAAVKSKVGVRYGYFEVRAQAMDSRASSAFWFYSRDPNIKTEIDVFEFSGGDGPFQKKWPMSLHNNNFPWADKNEWHHTETLDLEFRPADAFHLYGVEWDEQEVKFFLDGKLMITQPNKFQHEEMDMIFDSETFPDWFGLPDVKTLPSTFKVDWVRAWKKKS